MNYKIPEDFDFYGELKKNIQSGEREPQATISHDASGDEKDTKCLITGEELDRNAITLECGHTFNYIPIFNDMKSYRYDTPTGYYSYSDNLNLREHQIRCPYCRQVQENLLPYLPDVEPMRLKGVNYPLSLCMGKNTCNHVFKSGKNKGNVCNKRCYREKCNQHYKPEVNFEDISMDTNTLMRLTLVELRRLIKSRGGKKYSKLKKNDLIKMLLSI